MLIKNSKVVTAEEMAHIEKLAVQSGCQQERFIHEAGKKIADVAAEWMIQKELPKKITLLVGKGNNGADAYSAGTHLLEKGFCVRALTLYKEASVENQKFKSLFLEKGGKIEPFVEGIPLCFDELILDGLVGTAFRGEPEKNMASMIEQANRSGKPIFAIDIPSGLNGTTGALSHPSICAVQTIALGLAKIGFFLREGWNAVGQLRVESFGLPSEWMERAKASAYLLNEQSLRLPHLVRNRHKYQAGYVLGLGGSALFKGAPKLSGLAALRSGAGIVRIFHLDDIGPSPMELICEPWSAPLWKEELKRAHAVFLGPGLGAKRVPIDLKSIEVPCVIDADLLQANTEFPSRAIVTPHRGEMLRLLELKKSPKEEEFLALCEKFAVSKKVVLVLKGAPTFIFAANQAPLIIARGDPGMATAGAGDVLTGILAALLAQKMDCYEAAVLGVYLHAIAGERAALKKTSYAMIASDLIETLPEAVQTLICLNQSIK